MQKASDDPWENNQIHLYMNGLYDQILNNGQGSSLVWAQILVPLPAVDIRKKSLDQS